MGVSPLLEPGASPVDGGNKFEWHVRRELQRAREKHPKPIISIHAGYAIILEELEEFWDEVKKQQRDKPKMIEELVQIGAMAQRVYEDLELDGWWRPR
jgi:hypothetical protein